MTQIYFVRHAQPDYSWAEDMTRPLTDEGLADREKVTRLLREVPLDYAVSSPCRRSVDTIGPCCKAHGLAIVTDIRMRERESGENGNQFGMFKKRWDDFDYHELGGESLSMTQERNLQALSELLESHPGETVIWGTHGTALSTILHHFDPDFGCAGFLRIIDFMPYIVRLDFDGKACVGKRELLMVHKEYQGPGQ